MIALAVSSSMLSMFDDGNMDACVQTEKPPSRYELEARGRGLRSSDREDLPNGPVFKPVEISKVGVKYQTLLKTSNTKSPFSISAANPSSEGLYNPWCVRHR